MSKDFSDYAVVVVARVSGECFDLPTDMYEVIHNDSLIRIISLLQKMEPIPIMEIMTILKKGSLI